MRTKRSYLVQSIRLTMSTRTYMKDKIFVRSGENEWVHLKEVVKSQACKKS